MEKNEESGPFMNQKKGKKIGSTGKKEGGNEKKRA